MTITLSLSPYGRYISLSSEDIKHFEPNDIDEQSYSNGIIDIFDVLVKLTSKGFIDIGLDELTLDIIIGENRCIVIGDNTNFPNIKTITINGRAQALQIINISGFTGSVNITNCGMIQKFNINGNFGNIEIENDTKIRELILSGSGNIFSIKNTTITSSFNIQGSVIKKDLIIDTLIFHYDSDININFNFYGAIIGKLSLLNLDLPANGLNISNSVIHNVFFHQVNLEKLKLIGVGGNGFSNLDQGKNKASEMKEFYRQLKHSHDEIGNKTEANKFFAKEMEYHMKALKESGNKKDYYIALLQKEISDFGNDWSRAVIIYFIVALLGFGLAQVSDMGWNYFTDNIFCVPEFKSVWSEFIQYINPLPKIDEVPGLWYLLVSITKILIVYQIVVALRRISQR